MLSFLTGILGILPSAFKSIDNVTNAIANERLKQIQAKTDQEKIAAEERIHTLEAQRDALVAETQRSKAPIYIQTAVGAFVATVIGKLLVWDKVVGSLMGCAGAAGNAPSCAWFTTDPLGDDLRWITMTVIGFYFLASTASILKNK
jgi:hypothetical protein